MFAGLTKIIIVLGSLRLISGMIEMLAGLLILKFNDVEKAVMVNATLAIVGPIIFITSMGLGLWHLSDKLSYSKLLLIGSGVCLILIGLKK